MMIGLKQLLKEVEAYIDDPTQGLPEELFLFATEITPMVNVDLLIRDRIGQILLAWRNDEYHGNGWHVPGGILRVKESFEDRLQKTAERELGCRVEFAPNPLDIVPIITPTLKRRCHFITFVYDCRLPDDFCFDNGTLSRRDTGFLAWHKRFPEDMLACHAFYKKYFLIGSDENE